MKGKEWNIKDMDMVIIDGKICEYLSLFLDYVKKFNLIRQ
jgi:hypothetical protein